MKFYKDADVPDGYEHQINLRYVTNVIKTPLYQYHGDDIATYAVKIRTIHDQYFVYKGTDEEEWNRFYDTLMKDLAEQ